MKIDHCLAIATALVVGLGFSLSAAVRAGEPSKSISEKTKSTVMTKHTEMTKKAEGKRHENKKIAAKSEKKVEKK